MPMFWKTHSIEKKNNRKKEKNPYLDNVAGIHTYH